MTDIQPIPNPMDPVPPPLRGPLAAEIDPSEALRWTGQPGKSRSAWLAVRASSPLMLVCVMFGTMVGVLGFQSLEEARTGVATHEGNAPASFASAVTALSFFGLCVATLVLAPCIAAWIAVARAGRTIYALTNTRLISLRLTRSGLARITSLEPAHPLDIARLDHDAGRGTLSVQRVGQSSLLTLVGIANARRVDQLIRETFEPPQRGPGPHP